MARKLEAVGADAEALDETEPELTDEEWRAVAGPELLAQMRADGEAYRRGELKGCISLEDFLPILDGWIAEGERQDAQQRGSTDGAL